MKMLSLLNSLSSNSIIIFLCTICTIISVPISVFLYFRGIGVKRLKYISKWYIFDKQNDILPDGLYVPKDLLDRAPIYYAKFQPPPVHTRGGLVITSGRNKSVLKILREEGVNINSFLKILLGSDDKDDILPPMCDRDDNICIAKFVLWNSGGHCLDGKDVIPEKHICIYNQENIIISASVLAQEEETNHISAKCVDEHTVEIDFDYIDRNEGATIAIAYTGYARYSIDRFKLYGKVKGGLKIKHIRNINYVEVRREQMNYFHEVRTSKTHNIIYILFFGLCVALFFGAIIDAFCPYILNQDSSSLITLIFSVPYFTASLIMLLVTINNSIVPKKIWAKFNIGY